MGLLNFTGFELGPSSNRLLEGGASGTVDSYMNVVSSATTSPHDGSYSLKVTGDGSTQRHFQLEAIDNDTASEDSNFGAATIYVNFWFKYDLKVTSGHEMVCRIFGSAQKAYLGLSASGKLDLYDEANNKIDDGITALGAGSWYKIQLKIGQETVGGDGEYELRINNVLEYSATDGNIGTSVTNYVQFGNPVRKSTDPFGYYYDDIAIADDQFINPKVYRLDPNNQDAGTGITSDWATSPAQAADEQYLNCDEIPNDGNTSYIKGNTTFGATPHSSSWKLEDATGTIPANAEIVGVKVTGICFDPGTVGIDSHGKIWIYVNGTQHDPMVGYADFPETYYASMSLFFEEDPIGSGAWTLADIDSLIIGVETQDNNSDATMPRCTWLGAQVCTNQEETPIYTRRTVIAGNMIADTAAAIWINTPEDANAPGAYDQMTIVGNIIRDNTNGIFLYSNVTGYIAGGSGSVILGNVCYENSGEGIELDGAPSGTDDEDYINHVAIVGNVSGDDGTGDTSQSYGIEIKGRTENCVILANVCVGNYFEQIRNDAEDPLANEFSHNIDPDD